MGCLPSPQASVEEIRVAWNDTRDLSLSRQNPVYIALYQTGLE